jgi:hypothetical protein
LFQYVKSLVFDPESELEPIPFSDTVRSRCRAHFFCVMAPFATLITSSGPTGLASRIPGDNDYLGLGPSLLDRLEDRHAIHPGHAKIKQHYIGWSLLHYPQCFASIANHLDVAVNACQRPDMAQAHDFFVVNYQDFGFLVHVRCPECFLYPC